MRFLRNYFLIFVLTYLIIVATKFLFLFFYADRYAAYESDVLVYALFWGYRFDFALAAMVALLGTLLDFHRRAMRLVSAVAVAAVTMLQLSDILYFEDASRHIGYEITDLFNDAAGLFLTALSQNGMFTVLSLLLFPVLVWALFKAFGATLSAVRPDRYYVLKKVLLIGLSVFFIRGMFATIPLNPWQSSQIGDNRLALLALNGSYNALFSLFNAGGDVKMHGVPPLDKKALKRTFADLYGDDMPYTREPLRQNVVLFFLESWSGALMQPYGAAQSATPFYDGILAHSLHPKAAIANGHRTTEGMFASLVSYQNPLGQTVAKTRLQNFRYTSLVDLLDRHGYSSAFFQGTAKETSGTGALAQMLGFRDSYGKEDIGERRYGTNNWGVYDQDLYRFALQKLKTMNGPFVIGINGATTHDDKLPEGIEKRHFSGSEKENNRLNALSFADAALGEFVAAVEAEYPDTLFVFFADHCGGGQEGNFHNYMIPLAFYGRHVTPAAVDAYVSQRDIAPTVLDLVLGDYKKLAPDFTGKSLVTDRRFFADYYRNGVMGWIEGDRLVEYTPEADKTACFDVSAFHEKPIACTPALDTFAERVRTFTALSQTLLFSGKTQTFRRYRYGK